MVGGDKEDLEAARPMLQVLGKTITHVGPPGAGQSVKAANQMLVAGTIQLVSEALVLLQAPDVDMESAIQALTGGLANSIVLETRARAMLAGEFEPGFRVDLHHKDLRISLSTAREENVALPVSALVAQQFTALRAAGRGGADHTALFSLVRALAMGAWNDSI